MAFAGLKKQINKANQVSFVCKTNILLLSSGSSWYSEKENRIFRSQNNHRQQSENNDSTVLNYISNEWCIHTFSCCSVRECSDEREPRCCWVKEIALQSYALHNWIIICSAPQLTITFAMRTLCFNENNRSTRFWKRNRMHIGDALLW